MSDHLAHERPSHRPMKNGLALWLIPDQRPVVIDLKTIEPKLLIDLPHASRRARRRDYHLHPPRREASDRRYGALADLLGIVEQRSIEIDRHQPERLRNPPVWGPRLSQP